MSSAGILSFRNRQVPSDQSDLLSISGLGSPTSPSPTKAGNLVSDIGGGDVDDRDDLGSDYESSVEEKLAPATPHALFIDDPFRTDTSKILFESIDQLRKYGTGKDLELPQLVIVGKQSAGKSSLLQSLTDIPFPVYGTLCTRFATRIVSKRSAKPTDADTMIASIEPGDFDPFGYKKNEMVDLGGFPRSVSSMTVEAFQEIVNDATKEMGINSSKGSGRRNFSSEVLKIELTGPNRSYFGILDVPGVFSSTGTHVTDAEMDGVTQMVKSYMQKPENIIILVGDATDDLANQAIFKMAANIDSSRIVAVFTKCDQVQVKTHIVQIVKEGDGIAGKNLRWHVVRNRGPNESISFDREDAEAALFRKVPWLEIPEQQRGTKNLKSYLGNLLCKRIREGFPALRSTIHDKLQEQEAQLKSLGKPRENHIQQQAYLRDIVKIYEDLAGKALRSPAELPSDDIKLRGLTQNKNSKFAKMMVEEGHTYPFLEIGQEVEVDCSAEEYDSEADLKRVSVPIPGIITPAASPNRRRRIARTPSSGNYISQLATPQIRTISPLYKEISKQIETNRGEELPGMLNPAVLKPLWVKQTSKWRALGEAHLKKLVRTTVEIAIKIFAEATKSNALSARTRDRLEKVISDFGDQARKRVLSQLDDLYHKTATLALQTNNPQFEQNVNAARAKRFKGALERYRSTNPPVQFLMQIDITDHNVRNKDIFESWSIIDDSSITKLFNEIHPHGERAQNVQDEIHDLLKAYYDIAMQNFLHDIEFSIVEPFLQSKEGPLLGLSIDYILRLSEAEVEDIGGEDPGVVNQRKDTVAMIERLRQAVGTADEAWRRTREVESVGN